MEPWSKLRSWLGVVTLCCAGVVATYLNVTWSDRLPGGGRPKPSPVVLDTENRQPSPSLSPSTEPSPKRSPLSLMFVGDLMFDRSVWSKMQANGLEYPFAKLGGLLESADLAIGNLEGPVTERGTHAVPNGSLLFTFDPTTLEPLKASGLDLVSLANNHTHNQGAQGLADSRANLARASLTAFGDPRQVEQSLSATIISQNGWQLAFIGWNAIEVADNQEAKLLALIAALETKVDLTIVVPHWGAEYRPQTAAQVHSATAMVAAGADLIVGAHPHVVQGIEIIEKTSVIYSLGNFIFDQYWSEATQEGLAVKVMLNPKTGLERLELLPIHLPRSQPQPAASAISRRILDRVGESSPANLRSAIAAGVINLCSTDPCSPTLLEVE